MVLDRATTAYTRNAEKERAVFERKHSSGVVGEKSFEENVSGA